MLGMIIGVGSVIALLAFGNGYATFLDEQFDKLGVGAFYVFPGSVSRKVSDQPTPRLTSADAAALRFDHVSGRERHSVQADLARVGLENACDH